MAARVVSLVPSATETLLAWGVTPIAVTRFCEQPHLPAVGGTKNPDVDAIVALRPDVVVMCPEENRREDAERLRRAALAVHAVEIDDVADVTPALTRLAAAVGAAPRDPEPLPPPKPLRVRAFVPIWRRPWMTIGGRCYGASVLAHLGVENIAADAVERYPEVDLYGMAARQVDVVLAPSEPYPFLERHRSELERVAPVVFVDGKDLFWWGARTPSALRRLADALADLGRRCSFPAAPMTSFTLFESPLGHCGIIWDGDLVVGLQLPEASVADTRARMQARFEGAEECAPPASTQAVIDAVLASLRGEADDLADVPLALDRVAPFSRRVYETVRTIPAGETLSYGEVATAVGSPGAARAVGQALGRNPFPIVVPCHRVLAADGRIGGFSAEGGTSVKVRMLAAEGVTPRA